MSQAEIEHYLSKISADLDRTVDFWLDHSHDEEYGGFFNCLTEDGRVFDDTKYVWLQGRQVWTYCQLAKSSFVTPSRAGDAPHQQQVDAGNEMRRASRKKRLMEAAVRGGEFLRAHARDPGSDKCYFSLTRDGKPVKVQRTMFSESFYALAMAALADTTKLDVFKDEAKKMMDVIVSWVREDSSGTGAVVLEGTPEVATLAAPMILLNLTSEFEPVFGREMYAEHADWAVFRALQTCSGHAIEGAWFIMDWARKPGNDRSCIQRAIDSFLVTPFETGWDEEHGGIYSFLDVDGYSPLPLEWSMKLWWAHAEAMIAFLMAYEETNQEDHWKKFKKVADYVFSHVRKSFMTDHANRE